MPEARVMKAAERHEFFRRMQAINPQPKSDLEYRCAFELLVAVILSAQATDKSVNIATKKLFSVANTPEAIHALGEEALIEYIRTIGLFRTKAKNLLAMCTILIENHAGKVPDSREALEALPGVGRKTANVVLNVAFGQPTMAVDTHIFRISNRMGLAPGKNVVAVEDKLMKVVPKEFMDHAHHWLILHGRYTCIARKPKCGACPVYDICGFKRRADFVER